MVRAMVFYHLVRMKHVGTDLASPFDLGRGPCREPARFTRLSLFAHPEEFATDHFEGFFAILRLRAFGGDVNADAARNVRHAHSRIALVHILSTGATRARDGYLEFDVGDVRLGDIGQLRKYLDERK